MPPRSRRVLRRALVLALLGALLPGTSVAARAQPSPTPSAPSCAPGDGGASPAAAPAGAPDPCAQVREDAREAAALDQQVTGAQQQLQATRQSITELDTRLAELASREQAELRRIGELRRAEDRDRLALGLALRYAYEHDSSALVAYVLAADSFTELLDRVELARHAAQGAQTLVEAVRSDEDQSRRAVEVVRRLSSEAAQDRARAAQLASTLDAQIVSLQQAADAAHLAIALDDARASLALARALGVVYPTTIGGPFTIDSDLTQPSGLTAAQIDAFLAGSPMAGLGSAFIAAETAYHVNARYFVAHAEEESSGGRSQIAQDKHNLFGFGADDSNPYGDATTFASFADCIDQVARSVAVNYLSPAGRWYHGASLRGMNVSYASDPGWAVKIAAIASAIQPPQR